MAKFDPAVAIVLKNEGGLVHDKADSGGFTNHGISLRFYRSKIKVDATSDDIEHLKIDDAVNIYQEYFWNRNRYAELNSQELANKMLDLSVNIGAPMANKCLQLAINQLDPHEDLVLDGQMGLKTIDCANAAHEPALFNFLILAASRYYHKIAEHGDNIKFLNGWLRRLESCS